MKIRWWNLFSLRYMVCLPPPPPSRGQKALLRNQQKLSLAYVTAASETQHTVQFTPCTYGLIIFPCSPFSSPLSFSPRTHWKPMQCNVCTKKYLYMFDIIWNVSVRLVKWSHSPNHNEKLKEVLKYEKCSVQLKGVPSPWSSIQTTSCM